MHYYAFFHYQISPYSPLQVSYVVHVPVAVGSLWTFCPAVTLVKLALSYSSSGVSWLSIFYTVTTGAFMHVPSLISCDIKCSSLFVNVYSYRCGCDLCVCVCPDIGHWSPSRVESFHILCRSTYVRVCTCLPTCICMPVHLCCSLSVSNSLI